MWTIIIKLKTLPFYINFIYVSIVLYVSNFLSSKHLITLCLNTTNLIILSVLLNTFFSYVKDRDIISKVSNV